MDMPTAEEEKQGLMYQGRFSESLDFQTLHDKINQHLSFIRAQKSEEQSVNETAEHEKPAVSHARN